MADAASPIGVQRANFDTLEELSQALDQAGWDCDLLQLDQSAGETAYLAAGSPRVVISRFDFSNRLHQRAVPMQGFHTFGLLTAPQASVRFAHEEMDQGNLSFMDPRYGLDAVSEAGFSGYTLAVHQDLFEEVAEREGLSSPGQGNWRGTPGELIANAPLLAELRVQVADFFNQLDSGEAVDELLSWLEAELPRQLLWVGHGKLQLGPARPATRAEVRRRALEYLQANQRDAITVERLCEVSGSSIATLERAFRDQFGVTPKRYLLLNRLSGVRRALLDEPPERSITEIASDWSFNHMGKFAADYRHAFGELPSDTRRA